MCSTEKLLKEVMIVGIFKTRVIAKSFSFEPLVSETKDLCRCSVIDIIDYGILFQNKFVHMYLKPGGLGVMQYHSVFSHLILSNFHVCWFQ